MTTKILTLFTRTPLHVGAGASVGAVDQPVVRERHTRFPVIPGSSLKGVLADLFLDRDADGKNPRRSSDGKRLFGEDDTHVAASAGSLLVGESKLLAFPVRSAKGAFAFLTCPLAIDRFARDFAPALDAAPALRARPSMGESSALAPAALQLSGKVILEEYPLSVAGEVPAAVIDALAPLSDDAVWKNDLRDRLCIVSDELFQYFVENACEIAQHNRIDDETGVVEGGALFNQENVPSEALFYAPLSAKSDADLVTLADRLAAKKNLLQIGADATTGLGWCSAKLVSGAAR